MASSTKWRISITANNGGAVHSIAEIQMRASNGGADECSGGTATASSSGDVPSKAFDDNAATFWYSVGSTAAWIQYEFAAPKEIVEFTLQARPVNSANQTPKDFALEYWDGAAWVALLTVQNEIGWLVGETRAWNNAAEKTTWRLYCTAPVGLGPCVSEIQLRATSGGADQCTGGTASASSVYSATYSADKAFDNDGATYWAASAVAPGWLKYTFASATEVEEYLVTAPADGNYTKAPTAWALQHNNGTGGWTDFDTQAGVAAWSSGESRTYTLAVPDTTDPTPGTVTVTGTSSTSLTVNVGAGSDDTAVTSRTLQVFSDSGRTTQVGTDIAASVGDNVVSGLSDYTHYWVRVIYADAAANTANADADGWTLDGTNPTPGTVTVTGTDFDEITVNVGAGSDNVAVTSRTLKVYSDSGRTSQVGTNISASVGNNVVTGLTTGTTYYVRVVYADAAGNTANADASGSTLADTTAPTPGTVTVTGLNDTQLNVAVGAGSDNVAVVSRTLQVFSDAGRTAQVGTDIAASVGDNTVSGLAAETTYYVRVTYADAAGNTASVDAEGATLGDCWIRVAQMPLEVDYTIPSAALIAQAAVEVDLTGTTSVQIAHAVVEIDYVLGTDDDGGDGGGTPNDGTTVPPHVDEEIILGYDPQKHRIGLAVSYAVDSVVKHDLYAFDNEAGGWGRIEPTTNDWDFDTVTCRATAERDADAHLLFGNAAGQSLRVFDPDNAPVSWEWRSKEATGADFGGFAKTFQFTGLRVDWHRANPALAGSVTATVFIDGKPMPALNIAEQTSRTYVLGPRATGHRCSVALEGVNAEVTALRYSLAEARN